MHISASPDLKILELFLDFSDKSFHQLGPEPAINLRVAGIISPDGPEPPSGHPPPKSHNVYY